MFEGFKGLFGSKGSKPAGKPKATPAPGKPKAPRRVSLPRVNVARKYVILNEIGSGSMSRVYRAMEKETGRSVCLKIQDRAKTEAALARASQAHRPTEGEVGQKIVHPNVVRTFEFGLTPRREYFLVMEFIDGPSLTQLRQSRVLPLAAKLELLAQAADGLAAVHAAGFIHHDFGPKNLLVDRDDRVKLIDFGLSIPDTPEFRKPGNRTGTLNYLAPEVIRREAKDQRLDIFAWGVTAFEFLTNGKFPYDLSGAADPMTAIRLRMNADPMRLEQLAPHLPAELSELIDRAMARRPQDRWPSAATLGAALRELAVATPSP